MCSLIEHLGLQTHNRRGDVVDALGVKRIAHALEFADVLHRENIDAVADRYVTEAGIAMGTFDNVSEALYGCPSARDMGNVYKRLARGIMRERGASAADAVAEAFHSPIAPLLDDYNGSFFYEAPANSVRILSESVRTVDKNLSPRGFFWPTGGASPTDEKAVPPGPWRGANTPTFLYGCRWGAHLP